MTLSPDLNASINLGARLIRQGKLVAFPTETVYGLGGDALNPRAVAAIFELKGRPSFDPLIIHIASAEMLEKLTITTDPRVKLLTDRFWPGPLTLVLPKSDAVPEIVTSGLPLVGIRMPGNEIALELIKRSGGAIAAPSANKFGRISPTRPEHVRKQLAGVDHIIEGGGTQVGIESTIIRLTGEGFEILRPGIITQSEIEKVIPFSTAGPASAGAILAPGMVKSHYSPHKPLYILGETSVDHLSRQNAAIITFSGVDTHGYLVAETPSPSKDLKEYAVKIFAILHKLEDMNISHIVAEPVPSEGIGLAIMDRLRKAAFKYRPDSGA